MNKIEFLFPNLKDNDENYVSAISKKYSEYISYSQIPNKYIDYDIDTTILPTRLNTLFKNIKMIVDERLCLAFSVRDYSYIGYLSALLIDSYFQQTALGDDYLSNIIYVDTNLLMDDFKKLIDANGMEMALSHNIETLYKNIEEAPVVIWDRFSMITSSYERQKLYNILLSRYRKDLGNLYFIKNASESLAKICDREMLDVMNFNKVVSLDNEQLRYELDEKGDIKW